MSKKEQAGPEAWAGRLGRFFCRVASLPVVQAIAHHVVCRGVVQKQNCPLVVPPPFNADRL